MAIGAIVYLPTDRSVCIGPSLEVVYDEDWLAP
jgi:hypothetical protein